jgi:hypothetical protein
MNKRYDKTPGFLNFHLTTWRCLLGTRLTAIWKTAENVFSFGAITLDSFWLSFLSVCAVFSFSIASYWLSTPNSQVIDWFPGIEIRARTHTQKKSQKISNSNRSIWRRIYKRAGAASSRAWIERETGSPPNLTQLKREPRKEGAVAWLAILLHMRYYCCRTAARAGT